MSRVAVCPWHGEIEDQDIYNGLCTVEDENTEEECGRRVSYVEKALQGSFEVAEAKVRGICPRCGESHNVLDVQRLAQSSPDSYFYLCPENKQPVILKIQAWAKS
jgi:predicted RNA-binding Zn-ribbon protein involved in translation (DUF1610 family)